MHVPGPQIQPELPRETMAQPMARLGVHPHLGIARRGAGEVDHRRIVAASPLAAEPRVGLSNAVVEINPPCPLAAHHETRSLEVANLCRPVLVDRKSTRLNSSHLGISYAVFC